MDMHHDSPSVFRDPSKKTREFIPKIIIDIYEIMSPPLLDNTNRSDRSIKQ
jgi:hypothetical protein